MLSRLSKWGNSLLLIFLLILLTSLLYFLISPIFYSYQFSPLQNSLHSYTESRDYYSIINSIVGTITALVGLCFGYYYFSTNNKIAAKRVILESLLKRVSTVDKWLEEYNSTVESILHCKIQNESDLKKQRDSLPNIFEHITNILDTDIEEFKWEHSEQRTLLLLSSFVETNDYITKIDFDRLPQHSDRNKTNAEYMERLQDSRKILLNREEILCQKMAKLLEKPVIFKLFYPSKSRRSPHSPVS